MKGCISVVILALRCMLTQLWGLERGKRQNKGNSKHKIKIREEMSVVVVRGLRSMPANHPLYFAIYIYIYGGCVVLRYRTLRLVLLSSIMRHCAAGCGYCHVCYVLHTSKS